MIKKIYNVKGMHCTSCALAIEMDLEDMGVKASCNFAKQTLEVELDNGDKEEKIKSHLEKAGYSLV